jgi:NADPH-dependent 2,4-dienoyl-CoA reductase/sulfur reductase-like enzyme
MPAKDFPYDIAVVGAGPAGLTAAVAAAGQGKRVALIDAGARVGGQYWRHSPTVSPADKAFQRLVTGWPERIEHLPEHQVWAVSKPDAFVVHTRQADVEATALVLAPGAYDRQIPFPGWDLPGVYTAGAAQALIKEHGVLVGRRVAVAGTGPFLLPVATALAEHGVTVVGVFEANRPGGWLRPGGLAAIARHPSALPEAAGYAATLARHRVPMRLGWTLVAAHGSQAVEAVTVRTSRGRERRLDVDAVAVGWGFTPQVELPLSLGCKAKVDVDGSLVIDVDERQESSVPGVFVAGEATGVGGAALAACEGEIAGRASSGAKLPARLARRRTALREFTAAMHRTYPVPAGWIERLADDTLVCRCEEVTAGRLRSAVELGAEDARTAKLLSRVGMGWCQGRVCGYAAACLTSAWTGTPYDPAGLAERPIATPVTLGELAAADPAPQHSVQRCEDL